MRIVSSQIEKRRAHKFSQMHERLSFEGFRISDDELGRTLLIKLRNNDIRKSNPKALIVLYNILNESIGYFIGESKGIPSGESDVFAVDLQFAPKGIYKAEIIADCCGEYLVSRKFMLAIK
jgi:hypothetical protein